MRPLLRRAAVTGTGGLDGLCAAAVAKGGLCTHHAAAVAVRKTGVCDALRDAWQTSPADGCWDSCAVFVAGCTASAPVQPAMWPLLVCRQLQQLPSGLVQQQRPLVRKQTALRPVQPLSPESCSPANAQRLRQRSCWRRLKTPRTQTQLQQRSSRWAAVCSLFRHRQWFSTCLQVCRALQSVTAGFVCPAWLDGDPECGQLPLAWSGAGQVLLQVLPHVTL